jgi:hypothetical protein
VWVDAGTYDVLRLEASLVKTLEFTVPRALRARGGADRLRLDRADTSIRYTRVRFTDPDEEIVLPRSVDAVMILIGAGIPRLRVRQEFSEYRRFLTSGRIRDER